MTHLQDERGQVIYRKGLKGLIERHLEPRHGSDYAEPMVEHPVAVESKVALRGGNGSPVTKGDHNASLIAAQVVTSERPKLSKALAYVARYAHAKRPVEQVSWDALLG